MTHSRPYVALLIGMVLYGSAMGCMEKPMPELDAAQEALNRAIEEQAPELVPLIYARAEGALLAANHEMDAQMARWFWERNYSATIEFLTWAMEDGHRAADEAIQVKQGHENENGIFNSVKNASGL